LFWLTYKTDKLFEFKYLKCGTGQKFSDSLDIGFGDEVIMQYKKEKISEISKILHDGFAFNNQDATYLFIQKYIGDSKKSFTIYGKNKRADIQVVDNKWLIQRIISKPFPKKHTDFTELNVVQYPQVHFVESSNAKEAFEAIQAEEAKGKTLLSLWDTYSEIELDRVHRLSRDIGSLKYKIPNYLPDSVIKIEILNATDKILTLINEKKDEIIRTSVEIPINPDKNNKIIKTERFSIKSITSDYKIELNDKLGILPKEGTFKISTLGNEIVKKRRDRALRSLREDNRFITRNLSFAIENQANSMLEKKRKHKPLTDRTKKFLDEKFGISNLTQNQEEAVGIAINTPDIAIIQGPPGTGKSTVIAAVCDRLIEIAEKEKGGNNDKLILVSAFQNDTVEDIASKIYTLGLPTIKIGKETQSNIRAEDRFIEQLKNKIESSINSLSLNDSTFFDKFKQLKDIRNIYSKERNIDELKKSIEQLEILERNYDEWYEIIRSVEFIGKNFNKISNALSGLKTELSSYNNNNNGYYHIQKLLKTNIKFSQEDKNFLENAEVNDPSNVFLKKVNELKNKYLDEIKNSYNKDLVELKDRLLIWMDNIINDVFNNINLELKSKDDFIFVTLSSILEELKSNENFIKESIKNYGESLAATNQIAGSLEASSFNFENVILEEAARSNPLDLLIPISKATERIIMVGDQNQLPHLLEEDIAEETVRNFNDESTIAKKRDELEKSLFQIIFDNLSSAKPLRKITLKEQFRMHPFIGDFISRVYYDGILKNGLDNQEELKKHNLQLDWAKNKVAVFFNVGKNDGLENRGKSKSRPVEANKIIKILNELKEEPNFNNLNIGIITFYAKQVEVIFKEAAKNNYAFLNSDGSYEILEKYKKTADNREKLRIGSVDSFQGKEFDIIILSTVRSNNITRSDNNYRKVFGFLTLENRLNVAFSRAQKLLIVVGDGEMFSDDYAKKYVEGLYEFYNNLSKDVRYGNRL